jgi:hypothetical protein
MKALPEGYGENIVSPDTSVRTLVYFMLVEMRCSVAASALTGVVHQAFEKGDAFARRRLDSIRLIQRGPG